MADTRAEMAPRADVVGRHPDGGNGARTGRAGGQRCDGVGAVGAVQQPHVYQDGGMIGFGNVSLTNPQMPQPLNSPVFSGVATPDGGGYLLASADGGVFAFGDATFEGSAGALPLQGPIVAMATTPRRQGVLARRARRRRLRVRRRPVLRVDGLVAPQPAHRRHGVDARRQGLLARRGRRWHLRLRRRRLLRQHGQPAASMPRSSAWRRRTTARATGSSPPTAASSPSATRASTARRAARTCPTRSWAWWPRPTEAAI